VVRLHDDLVRLKLLEELLGALARVLARHRVSLHGCADRVRSVVGRKLRGHVGRESWRLRRGGSGVLLDGTDVGVLRL
jgi:hypothetical protein